MSNTRQDPERPTSDPSADSPPEGTAPPDWVGSWRVYRFDGSAPSVPTYYEATLRSWDVIKAGAEGVHVARHPVLEVDGERILLKDEGTSDENSEEWHAHMEGDQLRVTAVTGPHEGAIGIAERIEEDPRQRASRQSGD